MFAGVSDLLRNLSKFCALVSASMALASKAMIRSASSDLRLSINFSRILISSNSRVVALDFASAS